MLLSTSDHTPASNNLTNQPSLFRLLPLLHCGLFALSHPLGYLSPSFPQAMDEWDSSCLSVFTQCVCVLEGGVLIYCWSLKVSHSIPPLLQPPSAPIKRKQNTVLLCLFSFHFCGRHFSSILLFRLQRMFYYVTNLRALLLWPACSSPVAGRS